MVAPVEARATSVGGCRDALRCFALNGTDHRSHAEQNAAIAGYVR